ncbi:MAG: hypothetical protein HRT44_08325 [Bdellovibrionales bacterium]|nr:hypothetical protein [Bdellovibrionales bacterium]NQZ19245.1 hypothetical protein [Bdellovibrionales bacterium]
MKQLLIIISLFVIFQSPALAYIPRAKTIIKKMARNNGRRTYNIVREVTLQSPTNQVKAKETWTIASGDKMKLKVESIDSDQPWNFVIVYGSKQRKTLSASKKVKSFRRSPEFFEPLFHDRSSRSLTQRLIAHKFIPQWITDSPEPDYNEGKTTMTEEPFIRLAPVEGSVSYAMGSSKNSAGDNNRTLLWIEQDSFQIKKGRLGSKAEFTNSQYQSHSGGLKLPGEQTISWGDNVAQVKLMTVEPVKVKAGAWKLAPAESGTIPTDPLIKQFYSRFR